jgi:hypothetical protein
VRIFNSIFAAFLFVILAPAPSFAGNLDVDKVSGGDVRKWGYMSVSEATKQFSGYTFTMSRSDSMGRNFQKFVPFAGTAVFYFAPNNRVYTWAKKKDKIIVGRWWVAEPLKTDGDSGKMLLCFDYVGGSSEYYMCPIIKRYGNYIHERTKGNVFKLKAGAVPKYVKMHNRKLQKIMDDLKG